MNSSGQNVRKVGALMKGTQGDRRVRRTRQLLTHALLALLRERRYDDITVQDILDRANVGRSTFYTHFYDKDDLLLSGFERLRELFGAQPALPASECFSLAFFRHTAQHQAEYHAMVGSRGGEQVLRQVQQFLAARLAERMTPLLPAAPPAPELYELALAHSISTLFALMVWWFECAQPARPEQMRELYQSLVLPGLSDLLGIERARLADVL